MFPEQFTTQNVANIGFQSANYSEGVIHPCRVFFNGVTVIFLEPDFKSWWWRSANV
jgi:hypothetical protein